jgi:branched-chain amino acid transport system ATP-binding protein
MLLEVRDLVVGYGDIRAVSGVSLELERGELVSIIGANGAGKTSILSGIIGMVPVRSGLIRFKGEDITRLPSHRRANSGMRLVPERARLFPRLSVHENLMTGVYRRPRSAALEARITWLHELFPILKENRNQPAATLSGGQQQQLAIARALVSDPELLLVDEISMGLMPKLVDQVFELLAELNRRRGLTILLVEQNAAAALAISHRAYVLETGSCVFQGMAEELAKDGKLKAAYLGDEG